MPISATLCKDRYPYYGNCSFHHSEAAPVIQYARTMVGFILIAYNIYVLEYFCYHICVNVVCISQWEKADRPMEFSNVLKWLTSGVPGAGDLYGVNRPKRCICL